MVKLFCAIVGVPGNVFSVRVDEADSVDELKDAIKVKNSNKLKLVDADELQLYVAKTTDGKCGEDPLEVVLNGMDPPSYQQVHVLVVIPKQGQ
ncbi:unnamed protein product [Peronospora belbahrii]|uniref:Crinkler effector protein N-terminal domain-containing protein n=1 Tax=Peronospora belbahrii TaxID=622444 RepID=A0AAU9LBP3_9STRA|nr:unnamed protein product [Peronospora belbahrii]